MAAIKHTLQREFFNQNEERLVAVVHVTKIGRKRKDSFLCAAVTTEKPIQVYVYQIKKSDRGEVYKKKERWALRELKLCDGKDKEKDIGEFDMHFEKDYKWKASNISEKKTFIQCLWKLSNRYLVQRPTFNNVSAGLLEDLTQSKETDRTVQEAEAIAMATESDYHALSNKEESDLELMMSECDNAISNAEVFAEDLSKQLSVLDGANIHSIMGSEEQVLELMVLLDQGIQEAMKVEEKLDDYDSKLGAVKELMGIMKYKDSMIQVKNDNHHKLEDQLDTLINQLNLDPKDMKAILDGDLSTPGGICAISQAAANLQKAMEAKIPPSLEKMSAVQEQRRKFDKLRDTLVKRLVHHMNNLFIHQGNELSETLSRYGGDKQKLPSHHASHRDLLPYADLMSWLKQIRKKDFDHITYKVYVENLSKLYYKEVRNFMETARMEFLPRVDRKGANLTPGAARFGQGGSSSSLNKSLDLKAMKSASLSTLDSDSVHGSDPDILGRTKFDQMLELVLSELGPWCLAEQDFCVRFFSLTTTTTDGIQTEDAENESMPWIPKKPETSQERQVNKDVAAMMGKLFPSLEDELSAFIDSGHALDQFNSLYMLVRMGQHVINAEDTGSYLSKVYGVCLVHIKRNFDKFIKFQILKIEEFKLSRKNKTGIIPFVKNFEDFAKQAETIFKGSDRRTDLDKAYVRLVTTIFTQISRVANESLKTPREVVLLENFHHLYASLSRLKIACLDAQRREAKQRYQEHLQAYVTSYLGRPMEKISTFFEGIESKVASGIKADEIGYQLAYSKQELRKVIKEYPGKEVKKGLDHLYKKVDKHLCEEENLLQVLWHSMQDEFLKQYKHFEDLIAKCYPESQIALEFTINDLLEYFSDIARSH